MKQFFTNRTAALPTVSNPKFVEEPLPTESWEANVGFTDEFTKDTEFLNPLCDDDDISNFDESMESEERESMGDTSEEREAASTETSIPPSATSASIPAEAPAKAETSTPAVTASTENKEAVQTSSTPGAGYQTASLVVGETPLRIYAKNGEVMEYIITVLSQSNLLDATEVTSQTAKVQEAFGELGFSVIDAERSKGLCYLLTAQQAFIGGEVRPTPDAVRVAGAKAFVATSCAIKEIEDLATQCAKSSSNDTKKTAARKQILQNFINICNYPDLQITTLEENVSGNSLDTGRKFFPLNQGIVTFLGNFLKDDDSRLSSEKLQELAADYGHDLVEQLVQIAYKYSPNLVRSQLKTVYNKYCTQTKKPPTSLDGLLFNDELKSMMREATIHTGCIAAYEASSGDTDGVRKSQLDSHKRDLQKIEERFRAMIDPSDQNYASTHAFGYYNPKDESVTIDLGHIKIVVNRDQVNTVTLKSIATL
jgi:hypothetical protein